MAYNGQVETDEHPPDLEWRVAPEQLRVNNLEWLVANEAPKNVRMLKVEEMCDGYVISPERVRSLLGREMETVLKDALQNEGDEIIITGGTMLKMLFGVYTANPNADKIADIDLLPNDPAVAERLTRGTTPENIKNTYASTKFVVGSGETERVVEIVLVEELKKQYYSALNTLEQWANTLKPELQATYLERINNNREKLQQDDPTVFLANHHLFSHETISLKAHRSENGELEIVLQDPLDILNYSGPTHQPTIRQQLQLQENQGDFFGVAAYELNPNSLQKIFLDAMTEGGMHNVEFNSRIPVYALYSTFRLIKNACADMELVGDISENSADFEKLYELAAEISSRDLPITVTPKICENLPDLLKRKFQKTIVEAANNNLELAFAYSFAFLPLGNLISPDLASDFETYHTSIRKDEQGFLIPPNNLMVQVVSQKPEYISEDLNEIKGFRILRNYCKIAKLYNAKHIELAEPQATEGHTVESLKMIVSNTKPESMSEVIAGYLVAAGWNSEDKSTEIDRLIDNWDPKGPLKGVWQLDEANGNHQRIFEKGLNKAEIITHMQKIRERLTERHLVLDEV